MKLFKKILSAIISVGLLFSVASLSAFATPVNLDECCVKCRVLAPNPDTVNAPTFPYVATDDFFTINLKCLSV